MSNEFKDWLEDRIGDVVLNSGAMDRIEDIPNPSYSHLLRPKSRSIAETACIDFFVFGYFHVIFSSIFLTIRNNSF